ncbi:bifunctional GNAT family N-acetyltransferase/carbon-nitrogen hydrolase family protein [uncultured Thiohalocapsa sp.]|uniref:bifunctional GNAT family N-acetyltransferase/carbon-nitrogen hydrolase family protein n=1 Tax=uncultured Thiohalocapsa sp. TaxID=768990 RepID=UPI0025DBDD28|nr:bifunctional GNAT family N-acetyltransferase/carbon-nitrogen hydrolase family protein [uncultured Thiohalocapsa sp.]
MSTTPSTPNAGDNPADNVERLNVRNATPADVPAIRALFERAYAGAGIGGYTSAMIRGQINKFPEGQFVAEADGKLIGFCSSFVVSGRVALKPHDWTWITGGGYASRHDPNGDYLYGMEVCVDPDYRGLRIGQRLYDERKKLAQAWALKGIIYGGRLPTLRDALTRAENRYETPEAYVEAVEAGREHDPVLTFQLRNDFKVIGLMPGYWSEDTQSMGYGVHLLWRNPQVSDELEEARQKHYGGRLMETVRVATVQYQQRRVKSFDEFLDMVRYFVDVTSDYRADFCVFPELFSLQLLSMEDQELSPAEAIEALTRWTDPIKEALRDMAVRYNINIIGGSHPTKMPNGRVENICYVCLRDGEVHEQPKIHPTPNEVYWWNIEGGHELAAINTDCGPIGVLICYDAEFPELARHLADQGANIIFVPFCTDERQSYLRVRYCSQARAVENQCYVVMSGNCGNLPNVANMDIQYAQSCILTPCDFPFARDGIAADTSPNVETVAFADLGLKALREARYEGTVQNLKDRRHDLYTTVWRER